MLLYTRSSFLRWLSQVKECEIKPLDYDDNDRGRYSFGGILIKNGPCKFYMGTDQRDRIDYGEIRIICKKLWIELPNHSDLEPLE